MNAQLPIVGFARDPRTEPKVGDALERGGKIRVVTAVRHSHRAGKAYVSYKTTAGARRKVSIDAWRLWAASATVTKVAP